MRLHRWTPDGTHQPRIELNRRSTDRRRTVTNVARRFQVLQMTLGQDRATPARSRPRGLFRHARTRQEFPPLLHGIQRLVVYGLTFCVITTSHLATYLYVRVWCDWHQGAIFYQVGDAPLVGTCLDLLELPSSLLPLPYGYGDDIGFGTGPDRRNSLVNLPRAAWDFALLNSSIWGTASVIVVAGGLRAVGRLRRLRGPVPGHCRRCGYDMRATPLRCPECGTVAASPELGVDRSPSK